MRYAEGSTVKVRNRTQMVRQKYRKREMPVVDSDGMICIREEREKSEKLRDWWKD